MLEYGEFTPRHGPTGVPADHLVGHRSRHIALDHRGRVTALVADGEPETPVEFGAIAIKHTGTTDATWDGGAMEKNLNNDDGETEYREMYAWVDPDADPDTKSAYAFPHHMVDSDGKVGDANVNACSNGIGILNGGRGASSSAAWWSDRKAIFAHLVGHLKDSGVEDDDLPELKDMSAEDVDALAELAEIIEPTKVAFTEKVTKVTPDQLAERISALRARQAEHPEVVRTSVTLVDSGIVVDLPVKWDEDAASDMWDDEAGAYKRGAFVSTVESGEFAMTAAGDGVPQIVDNPGGAWHAILCVEGLRTDEDVCREIMPGACQFPDLPVSLRLQIHDEGGHWGAVTCGRIDTMERQTLDGYNAIAATGVFGTDEHGQTAQLLVEEQTQRFISIDPRNVDCEIVEVQVSTSNYYDCDDDDDGDVYDWWVRYTSLTIGAATIVATPALQQAVIAMADVPLPETPIAVATAPTAPVVASGSVDLAAPPKEWFTDPGFVDGDPRLVRQPDGHYACPLTVTEDGRVFGHAAYWEADHTAFPGRHRKPPHSPTYAYFMTGSRRTADGVKVPVGNLTMGVGHASTTIKDVDAVQRHYHVAHYDGGYGAVQMADVSAGEDKWGIWVAGALCEDVTAAQVRQFESLSLSGDWRERGGALCMVACLAVPVPGFPIAREEALVASAEIIDLRSVRSRVEEGECVALVAAGRVRRVPPDELLVALQRQMDTVWAWVRGKMADDDRAALAALVAADSGAGCGCCGDCVCVTA